MQVCKHSGKSKTKQKNNKMTSPAEKATVPGNRLYLDLSKLTVKSDSPDNVTINQYNWKVIVGEATGKKWSDSTVTKSDIVQHTGKHLNNFKSWNMQVW